MPLAHLYPLQFKPVYKDYLWGGQRIATRYRRQGTPAVCAESWEIADHPDGMSVVVNGPLAGWTLHAVAAAYGAALLGAGTTGRFPLLIKLIDARDRLSVQVHPNDTNAALTGGEPKTEMWYILDATSNAAVYAGFKNNASRNDFLAAMDSGVFDDVLARIDVHSGDAIFVPGGRVHAIDAGCLILEVQQNSNTTYRVWDWGRTGTDGKPRTLHIESALKVIDWQDRAEPRVSPQMLPADKGNQAWSVLKTTYFGLERYELTAPQKLSDSPHRFNALFAAEGAVTVTWADGVLTLAEGVSCLVPACMENYHIAPAGPHAVALRILPPG